MDRLQAAIRKAREERQEVKPPADLRGRPAGEGAAEIPQTNGTAAAGPEAAWAALRPLGTDPRQLARSRLVAHHGGPEAAPYDMLRTRMLQQIRANGWRRIALVSPDSGCGKSTTAANLAFSFGRQKDLRTMLLDLDMRRNGLAGYLQQQCKHNMGDVLQGKADFREHGLRHGDNVAFGLNGGPVEDSSEILQSQQALRVLEEIEAAYQPDIVLFDTPPMMARDDSHGFLKNTDCALIIAAAEKTTIDQIDATERQVAELTNVMGIVLNKCRYAGAIHGYDYGSY
ncbi:CpsD/CapB family tyrosine-protein kinase (plasmid) [Roseobacteraceae bacterium NS-SX3]